MAQSRVASTRQMAARLTSRDVTANAFNSHSKGEPRPSKSRSTRAQAEKGSQRAKDATDQPRPADLPTLLVGYRACPPHSKSSSFFAFVRERNPHVFSHHAHDRADYLDHVWRLGGLYICRGCSTVIIFTPLAFGAALFSRWPVILPTAATALIFTMLLLLSIMPLRDGPRTPLHDLRRVALGCLLGSAAAYVVICNDWALRGVVVGVYLAVLIVRRFVRRRAAAEKREE